MIIGCICGGVIEITLLALFGTAFTTWFRKRKWCKKSCHCKCHSPKTHTATVPTDYTDYNADGKRWEGGRGWQ